MHNACSLCTMFEMGREISGEFIAITKISCTSLGYCSNEFALLFYCYYVLAYYYFFTLGRYDPEGIEKLQIIQNGYDQSAGAVKGR